MNPQQFDKAIEALFKYDMKTFKHSGDLLFFKALSTPVIPLVADLLIVSTIAADKSVIVSALSQFDQRVWNNKVDDYCKRVTAID